MVQPAHEALLHRLSRPGIPNKQGMVQRISLLTPVAAPNFRKLLRMADRRQSARSPSRAGMITTPLNSGLGQRAPICQNKHIDEIVPSTGEDKRERGRETERERQCERETERETEGERQREAFSFKNFCLKMFYFQSSPTHQLPPKRAPQSYSVDTLYSPESE